MHTKCDHSNGKNDCSTYEAITDAVLVKPDANGQCPSGSSRAYKMNNTCPPHLRQANMAAQTTTNLSTCKCGDPKCVCTFCVPKTALNDEPESDKVYVSFRKSYKTPLSSFTVRELRWPENMSSRPQCNSTTESATLNKPGQCIDCLLPNRLISNYICDNKMTTSELIQNCRDSGGTSEGKMIFLPE